MDLPRSTSTRRPAHSIRRADRGLSMHRKYLTMLKTWKRPTHSRRIIHGYQMSAGGNRFGFHRPPITGSIGQRILVAIIGIPRPRGVDHRPCGDHTEACKYTKLFQTSPFPVGPEQPMPPNVGPMTHSEGVLQDFSPLYCERSAEISSLRGARIQTQNSQTGPHSRSHSAARRAKSARSTLPLRLMSAPLHHAQSPTLI